MNTTCIPLELLAPAKDLESGISAINHGADAVYIGASNFGARKSACNSLEDIEKLVQHAHLFNARVYVTLNTILFDNELTQLQQLIWNLYKIKVDAIIIQDFGILEMDLPPIPIHASTQLNNRDVSKVKFLESIGFDQVVLARELSLTDIKQIRQQTSVTLEYFIHGALCVCYSGQCYMSRSVNQRSANRGDCAQPCRLAYKLTDRNGKILLNNKHVLSLKDLNHSDNLQALVHAGITSFKIEGRLKDTAYVTNNTAHYRQLLDRIIESEPQFCKSSSGQSYPSFTPNVEKTFNRGYTDYFFNDRRMNNWSPNSPKALGENIGKVSRIHDNSFTLAHKHDLNNGDGLCFFNRQKQLQGLKINSVKGEKIYPLRMNGLYAGATVFRNYDTGFLKLVSQSTEVRKLKLQLFFQESGAPNEYALKIKDEDGLCTTTAMVLITQTAKQPELVNARLEIQLRKTGNTPFEVEEVNILSVPRFFNTSEINSLRRTALENHSKFRKESYQVKKKRINNQNQPYPLSQEQPENRTNRLAKEFFNRHGQSAIEPGFDTLVNLNNKVVMTTKHCILYEMDQCLKLKKCDYEFPLFIENEKDRYQLKFDCQKCEMQVIKK